MNMSFMKFIMRITTIYKKKFRRLLYQLTIKYTFQFNFQFSLQVIFADLRIENGDLRM